MFEETETEIATFRVQTAWDREYRCWRVELWYERNPKNGDFTKGFTLPIEFTSKKKAAAAGLHLYRGIMVGGHQCWWANIGSKR